MGFEDEVRRLAAEIGRRLAVLGEDEQSPDFWALVSTQLADEARRLGVDRLALMIAVRSVLADQSDTAGPSTAMRELLAPLRTGTAGAASTADADVAARARELLDSTVSYVVQEAYKGSALSFWHVLIARLRVDVRRETYDGPALVEALLAAVRQQTGVDAERRPNEAAVVLCRAQLQRDFHDFAARRGILRLVIYPDGTVTYRTVGSDDEEPDGEDAGGGELYSDADSPYTAVEEGDEDEDEDEE
ncbi:MAG: hypothetical protein NVSMB65_12890 [Chloroflexota bacterium]